MITRTPEPRLEPKSDFIQTNSFEPEPLSDDDLCRLEQEVFITISDETLNEIYRRLDL